MNSLGSVLEPRAEGPRGEDLSVEVEVPRSALGDTDGHALCVPLRVPHAGELATRTLAQDDEGERIRVQLPRDFPQNGALRLPGRGCGHASGRAGDLILKIRVIGDPPRAMIMHPAIWLALLAGAAALAYAVLG